MKKDETTKYLVYITLSEFYTILLLQEMEVPMSPPAVAMSPSPLSPPPSSVDKQFNTQLSVPFDEVSHTFCLSVCLFLSFSLHLFKQMKTLSPLLLLKDESKYYI